MEVPANLRSALVGFRYWLAAFLFLATATFLVSCSGEGSKVIVVNADIGTIVLTIEDASLVAGGVDTTKVTAEVFKFNGDPVPDGTIVNLTITPIGNLPDSAVTKDGVAVAILTSDTAAGAYHITAKAGNIGQVASGEFIPGPAYSGNTSLSANPSSLPADGTSISFITLIAKDAYGNPVADGTEVNFYTTAGTLSDATGVTENGVATTALISAAGEGVIATVTAAVDGLSKTTKVGMGAAVGNGTGTASYIELSISDFTIRVKEAGGKEKSVITAVARDEEGSAIIDYANNIRFSIENGPNGGEELDNSLAPVTKTTANGAASVSLTSGTVSGTVRIRVEVILDGTGSSTGAPFATALTTSIAIEAGEPSNIVIFQDTTIQNNNDGSTSRTISALAQDLHGNPVENGTVIYFGLVDNPDLSGPPYLGYISSGTNGVTNGTAVFTSTGNTFQTDGLIDDDILIILEGRNEGGHRIKSVDSNTALTLYNSMIGSQTGLDFVAGYAELGSVCGSVQTGNLEMDSSCAPTTIGGAGSIRGVGHTKLTWVPQGIFKPFCLYAESVGGFVGDTLCGTYPASSPVGVTVTIIPDTVLAGTTGIFVEAEFIDGSDNPVQGEEVTFTTSNPLLANFNGAPATIDDTDSVGKASTNKLQALECLEEQTSVTVTAAIAAYSGEATLNIQPTAPSASFTCTDAGDNNHVDCTDNSTTVTGTTISDWSWDVDCNGSEQSGSSDPTLAIGPGTTEICLTVTSNIGCSATTGQLVTIGAGGPTAAFTYTNNGDATASFSNASTAAPGTVNTTYAWTFPAGAVPATSSQQNPANVNFAAVGPGAHSVTLTVTNDFAVSDSVTNPVTVTAPPVASFTLGTDNGDGTADLLDASTTPGTTTITSRLWTFPAGTVPLTSTALNPAGINFGASTNNGTPGDFNVQLQVTNSFGASNTTTQTISLTATPVVASFTDSDNGDATADLTDTSTTPGSTTITSWLWTFPDATTSTATDPTGIDFAAMPNNGTPGDFDVQLQVTNNFGTSDTTTQTVTLVAPPTAAAAVSDVSGVTPCTLSISNTSTGPGNTMAATTAAWVLTPDVGPPMNYNIFTLGDTSFAAGTTTVDIDLTMTNAFGQDSITTITQLVGSCPP